MEGKKLNYLGKLDDYVDITGSVTVERLIKELEKFDPNMPFIVGAEGVFQGSPDGLHVQMLHSGEIAVVLWA